MRRLAPRRAVTAAALLAGLAGCGSSAHTSSTSSTSGASAHSTPVPAVPVAARLCQAVRRAAAAELHGTATVRILASDPGYLECLVRSPSRSVDVNAQAVPQARTHFNTQIVHLIQTYSEPGGSRDRTQLPHDLNRIGAAAAWVPGQHRMLATNATTVTGGTYVTVTVGGHGAGGTGDQALARAVALATLATAPRGPAPGPPGS